MERPPAKSRSDAACRSRWLARTAFLLVLAAVALEYRGDTSLKKAAFEQVRVDRCSSWTDGRTLPACIVSDPGKPTAVSLTAAVDHEVLYFALVVRRRFSPTYRGSLYYRVEFAGKLTHEGGDSFNFESRPDTQTEGGGSDWEVSFPRRIVWAKQVRKGQKVTLELNFVKIFTNPKTSEFDDDFAQLGTVDFALVSESDTNWVVRRILAVKAVAFAAALLVVCFLVWRAERGSLHQARAAVLAVLGLFFLAATYPFSVEAHNTPPEEYFSNKTHVMLSFLAYTGLETFMGYQALLEAFSAGSKIKRCLVAGMGITYLILWYVRHVHLSDFEDSASVYSEGDARLWKLWYFKTHLGRTAAMSSAVPLVISLASPLSGSPSSPVSFFVGYMLISFILERHVLVTFSTWKFARDLAVWILGYLYLIIWVDPTSPEDCSAIAAAKQDPEEVTTLNS